MCVDKALWAACIAVIVAVAVPAGAAIIATDGISAGESVLFTAQTGPVVFGTTALAQVPVLLDSYDVPLTADASGVSGSFAKLSFGLASGGVFNDVAFTLISGGGLVDFTLLDDTGVSYAFNGLVLTGGSTLFGFRGIDGSTITSVVLSASSSVSRLQDLRLEPSDGMGLPVVPEPATWALMIAGFAITGVAARRRRRFSLAD